MKEQQKEFEKEKYELKNICGAAVTFRRQRKPILVSTGEPYSIHCKTSPQYSLILRNNSGP